MKVSAFSCNKKNEESTCPSYCFEQLEEEKSNAKTIRMYHINVVDVKINIFNNKVWTLR